MKEEIIADLKADKGFTVDIAILNIQYTNDQKEVENADKNFFSINILEIFK